MTSGPASFAAAASVVVDMSLDIERCRPVALPVEVLPAVEADHLARDRPVFDEVANGAAELGKLGTVAERQLLSLAAELGVVLPDIGNRRAGCNAVDPHPRRQRLRQRDGGGGERRLGDL